MQKSTSLISLRSLLNHLQQEYTLVQLILGFKVSNEEKNNFVGSISRLMRRF